jgi:hypothetical protein
MGASGLMPPPPPILTNNDDDDNNNDNALSNNANTNSPTYEKETNAIMLINTVDINSLSLFPFSFLPFYSCK